MDQDITTLKKNLSQLQQASLLDSEEETMDMQESSLKRQSISSWQELHSPTQSTPESTPQASQQMQQPEHGPGKKPNTKNF